MDHLADWLLFSLSHPVSLNLILDFVNYLIDFFFRSFSSTTSKISFDFLKRINYPNSSAKASVPGFRNNYR